MTWDIEVGSAGRYGAAFDRVPRAGESYVKDFKPFRIGTISLAKSRGRITLWETDIAGERVADVRYVALTRVQ